MALLKILSAPKRYTYLIYEQVLKRESKQNPLLKLQNAESTLCVTVKTAIS